MRLCSCKSVAAGTDVCGLRVVGAPGSAVAASLRVSAQQSVRAGVLVVLAVLVGVLLELWSAAMGLGCVSVERCWTRVSVVWLCGSQDESHRHGSGHARRLYKDSAASSLDALFPSLSWHNSGGGILEGLPLRTPFHRARRVNTQILQYRYPERLNPPLIRRSDRLTVVVVCACNL